LPLLRAVFVKREPIRQAAAAALRALTPAADGARPLAAPEGDGAVPLPHRGVDGLDVAQLLTDAATGPAAATTAAPAWVASPKLVAQAVAAALREHRDTMARTLGDLLAGCSPVASSDAAPARCQLGLGPLTAQLPADKAGEAVLAEVARAVFLELKESVLRPPGSPTALDPQLLGLALQVLGVLAEPAGLVREVGATLMQVMQTATQGEAALQAAAVLKLLPAAALGPAPPPLLDALVRHRERWVRLAALDAAAHPVLFRLLSERALAQAATDPDGYVRTAAAHLASQHR
jgi:hypothetical protein